MAVNKEFFGTDGIRGKANAHPMVPEMILKLGRAAAYHFKNGGRHHAIVVGRDTRLSGYMLESSLTAGICSAGIDVLLVGSLPTPGIAFLTKGMRVDAGTVISASHNGFQDNGIKFFDGSGYKLTDEVEARIERLMNSDNVDRFRPDSFEIGSATNVKDAAGRYVEHLKNSLPKNTSFEGLRIVIDCANGAAYKVAPAIFRELGAHVIPVGITPNGTNINSGCGSLHTELMRRTVRDSGADLGIALDGDADRVIMCDEKGAVVDGDVMMAINAKYLKERGLLRKNAIVTTVMSNIGLDFAMKDLDIKIIKCAVGDRYVVHEMQRSGVNFGGEQSGHIIFFDHNTTGDGTLAALQTVSMLVEGGKKLSEAKKIMKTFPQVLNNVKVKQKKEFHLVPKINDCIKRVEKELAEGGRVLVRYSGTEMLARVMIEGEDFEKIKAFAEDIAEEIQVNLN